MGSLLCATANNSSMGKGSSFRSEPFILGLVHAIANHLNFLQQLQALLHAKALVVYGWR